MNTCKYPDGIRSYAAYLTSRCWKAIRRRVLLRDKGKCQVCGSRAQCVHHIDYKKATLYGQQDTSLISLCDDCHAAVEWDGESKIHADEWKRKYRLLSDLMRKHRGITLGEWQGRKPPWRKPKKKKSKKKRPKVNRKALQESARREHQRIGAAADASLTQWRSLPHWQRRNLLMSEAG